jgi:uncharacterized repeat protein (TIGR03803 family)
MNFHACTVLFAAAAISLPAQTFTTLYIFTGTNGDEPNAPLILGANGNMFGTTLDGGANSEGSVFEVNPAGGVATLYSFCTKRGCSQGEIVATGVVQAANGDFYGTTSTGGTFGWGTIYQLTGAGVLTEIYDFHGATDGGTPSALIQGSDSNFYGVTSIFGPNNAGTVFQLTPSGTLTTLHAFCSLPSCADGSTPYASLLQASDGNLYGTTSTGGSGYGTVFRITPSGQLTTLVAFDQTNGSGPSSPLIQGSDGNIYGATSSGGSACPPTCHGAIFKMTLSGQLTTLYSSAGTNGAAPSGPLVEAANGHFYGFAGNGGNSGAACGFPQGCGTLFELTPGGTLTTLHVFCEQTGCPDGSFPSGLVQDTNGSFYGVTLTGGGPSNAGTIFRLSVGLGPLVETQTSQGPIGATVRVLGTGLMGATKVTFNGVPAVFSVLESSVIIATVPRGATSGPVQVTLPSGTTLSTVIPYTVLN